MAIMMRGTSLVWVAGMAVLTSCLPETPPMPTGQEAETLWLPFLLQDPQAALNPPLTRPHKDTINSRTKRVFLSRGWGPGGYDAPPPPSPQRSVRRPLPSSLGQANTNPLLLPLALREQAGQARFAALVSTQQQETQQKPQYRRFHSIFTSGTWSPLGKRSVATTEGESFLPVMEETDNGDNKVQLLFTKTKPLLKDKRSGVFASQGWGAGGSPTPTWSSSFPTTSWTDTQHPWLAAPLTTSNNSGGGSSGGGDRYVASFRSGGPLLHHFLSHGWRPMGR